MEQAGLVLDNIFNPKNNSWINGKNLVIPKGTKSFQNERGFTFSCDLPYPCIGEIATPEETVVFLSNNAMSEIGVVRNNTYTPKLREPLLAFNIAFPITGTYTYNHLGELIIAWTDDNNSPKILNLGNMPFVSLLTNDLALVNKNEFTVIELFPTINSSVIEVTSIVSGGNLPSGAYYILCSYGYEDGSTTSWFSLTNPISIYSDMLSTNFNSISGSQGGIITDKAININILDIDRNFSYVNIAVITKSNGISSAVSFAPIPIINNVVSFNIANLSTGTPINITELLVNNPVYKQIKNIVNHNSELICSNVVGLPQLDIQPYVNKISINWYRDKPVSLNGYKGSYKDPLYISKYKGFRAGEVYGFLAAARLKQGGYYGIYPIPGRPAGTGDKTLLDVTTAPNDILLDSQVYKFQTRGTALENGEMGYWENRNEVYPATFPPDQFGDALANTPVRHHKFPTLAQLTSWDKHFINDSISLSGDDTLALLNTDQIDFEENGVLNLAYDVLPTSTLGIFTNGGRTYEAYSDQNVTFELASTVTPELGAICDIFVRIRVYTNTNVLKSEVWTYPLYGGIDEILTVDAIKSINLLQGEKLVFEYTYNLDSSLGADITLYINSANFGLDGTVFSYPLGITIGGIDFPDEIKEYIDAIEIFYYERTPENMTILDQCLLYPNDWRTATSIVTDARFHGFDIQTLLSSLKATHVLGELEYEFTQPASTIKTVNYLTTPVIPTAVVEGTELNLVRVITESLFFPADNTATLPSNYSRENCLFTKLNDGYVVGTNKRLLVNLCSYKTDVYNNMFNQRVVSTGYIIKLGANNATERYNIFGGDTFISPYGFMLWISPDTGNELTPINDYIRMKVLLAVESTANIGLRYETMLPHEKFYPKTDVATEANFVDGLIYQYGNFLGYNNDYNSLNNLKSFVINNPSTVFNNIFKYRIIRSLPQAKESVSLKWRIFPATLYYDMPMNKGEITGLVSQGQILFILHKYATYKAVLKDLLQLFNTNAYLAQGDIFDREPTEIYPTSEGYIGYQSKYAAITTEFGLVVVDRLRGKVFLIADDVKELTTPDVEERVKEYLQLDTTTYLNYPILASEFTFLVAKLGTVLIYADQQKLITALQDIDNPVAGKGILLTYDKLYKRVLLTVNNVNKLYEEEDTTLGTMRHGYLKFSCINSGYSDVDATISFILGSTSVTLTGGITPGANKFIVGSTREQLAANIVTAIAAIIANVSLVYRYTVIRQNSDVIITAISDSPDNVISAFSTTSNNIALAELIPFYIEEDKSITLSFSLQSMIWLFKHDYLPALSYNDVSTTKVIQNTAHASKVFTINDKTKFTKYFTDTANQSFIDIPINLKDTPNDVFVDNINVLATVRNIVNNHNFAGKSITHYAIYTQNQCTGLIPIVTLGYINEASTAHFEDRNLIVTQFRDVVIDHDSPFIDIDGNFLADNLAGTEVTDLVDGREYITSGIVDGTVDYAVYDGVTYKFNNQIIVGKDGVSPIETFGNIILKTYKSWDNYSYIADKLIVVRLIYDNVEQHSFELNNVFVNNNKK